MSPQFSSRLLVLIFFVSSVFAVTVRANPVMPAPDWTLKDIHGKTVKLSEFRGKVVILDFWAPWCPPCVAEIPNFISLQAQYQSKGLEVIGVSVFADQAPEDVPGFVKAHRMNYTVVLGDDKIVHDYGDIQGIPSTLIIDPKGNIVDAYLGPREKSVFETEIKKLLPATVASAH